MGMAKPSIATRLKARLNELRETRADIAKRSATVAKRRRVQRNTRRELDAAVKAHAPEKRIDALTEALGEAHRLMDKARLSLDDLDAREARIEKKVKFLKDHLPKPAPSAEGLSTPNAPWNPNHKQISNSIVPWLQKTWDSGCHFEVVSAYRDPQLQCELCRNMCGNCAGGCPGRCAPMGQSNHQKYGPGQGAVDVTNYYAFKAAQYRIGSPLRNYLGGQDPVHFSFTGR